MPIAIPETPTTAQVLNAFYKELVTGGLDPELAGNMTRDASSYLVRECGLAVRND